MSSVQVSDAQPVSLHSPVPPVSRAMRLATWAISLSLLLLTMQLGGAYYRLLVQRQQVEQAWRMVIARCNERDQFVLQLVKALPDTLPDDLDRAREIYLRDTDQLAANADAMLYVSDALLMRTYGALQRTLHVAGARILASAHSPELAQRYTAAEAAVTNAEERYEIAARTHNSVREAVPQNLVAWVLRFQPAPTFAHPAPSYLRMPQAPSAAASAVPFGFSAPR